MSTERHHARLDDLAREIGQLDELLIVHERDALELACDEEWCDRTREVAARTRLDLERALREYFILAEFVRRPEIERLRRVA